MSTEATGDGGLEAVGAGEPEAGTENATPAADETDAPGEAGVPDEAGEAEEADEADEFDVPEDDYGEYTDDEVPESADGDEALEYDEADEDYASYESYPGDDAEPPRARRGRRLLIAGGSVVLAAAIVAGAIAIVGTLTHGFKKPVKVTYKTSAVFKLKTGDCFDSLGAQSYSLVSCDAPHEAEVFGTFAVTGATWPGVSAMQSEARAGCASRLTGYVNPQLAISLTSTYVYPDAVAWRAGTRNVICEVRASSGQLTGSVRGATASVG